jgi:cyclic beta-1,2-glucan synthetase
VSITNDAITAAAFVDEPIRAELFGVERLEQHAESLAAAERITNKPTRKRVLLPRVRENRRVLVNAYHSVVVAVGAKREITLAEEWFLDNFHVVDEQIREIRDHLPTSYYRRLPKIAAGHLAGCPRVYGIAWAYVAHTDTRFEVETLRRFIRAYQRIQPLSIGEIWAVPIHLRMALVENLRRLSDQVIHARHARAKADELADRLLGLSGRPAESTESVLHGLNEIPLADAFAVQLVQRLRDQDESITPALVWLDHKLSAQGTSPGKVIAREHHSQAAANATVRNIITSMRWMSSIDWLEFFESVSLVDEELRANETFQAMDFATRDEYRKQVEFLSRGSGQPEIEVARKAVLLARQAAEERRRQHIPAANGDCSGTESQPVAGLERAAEDPGFYLLSRGRRKFERQLGFRADLRAVAEGLSRPSNRRLPGTDHCHYGRGALRPAEHCRGRRRRSGRQGPAGNLGPRAGLGYRGSHRPPVGSRPVFADEVSQAGICPGRACGVSNACRRADASHARGRNRGAACKARGPLPLEPGRPSALCPRDRLAGCDLRANGGRRGAGYGAR